MHTHTHTHLHIYILCMYIFIKWIVTIRDFTTIITITWHYSSSEVPVLLIFQVNQQENTKISVIQSKVLEDKRDTTSHDSVLITTGEREFFPLRQPDTGDIHFLWTVICQKDNSTSYTRHKVLSQHIKPRENVPIYLWLSPPYGSTERYITQVRVIVWSAVHVYGKVVKGLKKLILSKHSNLN